MTPLGGARHFPGGVFLGLRTSSKGFWDKPFTPGILNVKETGLRKFMWVLSFLICSGLDFTVPGRNASVYGWSCGR